MLFQHIYNWVKYKTLPPSLLFKNRLFIERDSKFRRITNNLGLTFRNSKWTNFEMNNLHLKFLTSYYLLLGFFGGIFFIIFTYVFFEYYSASTIFNNVAFILWSGIDLIDYYTTFIIWSTFIFLTLFVKGIYSYLFGAFESTRKYLVKEEYLKRFHKERKYEITDNPTLAKYNFKWVIFHWLLNSNSQIKDNYVNNFFQPVIIKNSTTILSLFFYNLFRTVDFLTKFHNEKNIFNASTLFLNIKWNNFFAPSFYDSFNNPTFLMYPLLKTPSYFITSFNSFHFNYKNYNLYWNLNFKNNQIINSYQLPSLFYMSSLKLISLLNKDLFKEYFIINNNLLNKSEIIKANRWLYRYSLTHRRNFKNSHKLTLTKKLIGTGLLDKNLSHKNIWHSEFINKFSKNNSFHHINNLLYSNYFNFKDLNSIFNDFNKNTLFYTNNLKNFSLYEHSFFWMINRFKFQNNLINNDLFTTLKKYKTFFTADQKESESTDLPLSIIGKNIFLNQPHIFWSSLPIYHFNSSVEFPLKDLILLMHENECFSAIDTPLIIDILQNNDIIGSSHLSFLYFTISPSEDIVYTPSTFNPCVPAPENEYILFLDNTHLNDIHFYLSK